MRLLSITMGSSGYVLRDSGLGDPALVELFCEEFRARTWDGQEMPPPKAYLIKEQKYANRATGSNDSHNRHLISSVQSVQSVV